MDVSEVKQVGRRRAMHEHKESRLLKAIDDFNVCIYI